MKKYHVEIIETTYKVFEVEADDYDEAEEKIRGKFEANEIDLTIDSCHEVTYQEFFPE